jgi:hypothetical protein
MMEVSPQLQKAESTSTPPKVSVQVSAGGRKRISELSEDASATLAPGVGHEEDPIDSVESPGKSASDPISFEEHMIFSV